MLRSICRIDVSHFPFDDQCCTLKFGSWSFDASKIDLVASNSLEKINSYYIKNGEWQLLSIKANFPFLAQYYWATIVQTGMSLVVTTVTLHCYHRNQRKMYWLVRKVFLVYINQLIFCQKKSNDDETSEEELIDKFNYCQMNESFNSQRR